MQQVETVLHVHSAVGWNDPVDAHDLGAQVRQQHGAERPRTHPAKFHDSHAYKRPFACIHWSTCWVWRYLCPDHEGIRWRSARVGEPHTLDFQKLVHGVDAVLTAEAGVLHSSKGHHHADGAI